MKENVNEIEVIFIAGAGRSGSTLLERMMGQSPGILPAGELTHVWERGYVLDQLCGCGEPFSGCPFWRRVSSEAFGDLVPAISYSEIVALRAHLCSLHQIPRLLDPRLRTRRFRCRYERYTGLLARLYRSLRDVSQSRLIVDSSKYPAEAFLLASMPNVKVSIVHLIRNSNAVAYAWRKWKERPEIHWKKAYMPRHSIVKTAMAWNIYNVVIGSLAGRVPYALVRYEDLALHPVETLARLSEALSLELGDMDVNALIQLDTQHTVSGNPMRFDTGRVALRLDEEWRTNFPRGSKAMVNTLTFLLQRRYGYL